MYFGFHECNGITTFSMCHPGAGAMLIFSNDPSFVGWGRGLPPTLAGGRLERPTYGLSYRRADQLRQPAYR